MRTRQKRRKREKHIGSLYFEPLLHRHIGGKGENNMAPRGRHLIETKDQKMFIMSIVQKKGSENIMSIVPHVQANRTKGEKKSWLLKGEGGHRPFPRKPEKISSPSDHLKSNPAFRNRAGSKQKWRHLRVYNQQRHSCRDIVRFQ